MKAEVKERQLLTANECAKLLNISRATLSRLIAKKAIPHYRIGLRTMFSPSHVEEYLRSVERPQINSLLSDTADDKGDSDEEI